MNGHEPDDRLALLALGLLPELDARVLETHVTACATCRLELAGLRDALAVLPLAETPEKPRAEVKQRLFARLETAPVSSPRPMAWNPLASGLAAALVLALLGDGYFALRAPVASPVTVATTKTAAPVVALPSATERPLSRPTPRPRALPKSNDASALKARAEVAALRAALARERALVAHTERIDRAAQHEVAKLELALTAARRKPAPKVIAITPAPEPTRPSAATPELLAALETGRVYSVDGVVDAEPWHCTIVQPDAGGNAFIITRAPSASPGYAYRTWVLRGSQVFDAATLQPGQAEALTMPMPLVRGDVVTFSLEPDGSRHPSTPYLMQVTITV